MPVCVCMQSRDQAINLAVALALFFVLLGIPWHSAASFEDDMFWDNTAANQFCHSCRIKLYCHAYLVSARVLSSLVQCEVKLICPPAAEPNAFISPFTLQDTQTCSYFCHFCNHGNLERKHEFISSSSDLQAMRSFVRKDCQTLLLTTYTPCNGMSGCQNWLRPSLVFHVHIHKLQ
eukprot:scaffold119993_cov18-Tisochrysis_lutea.AAC.1